MIFFELDFEVVANAYAIGSRLEAAVKRFVSDRVNGKILRPTGVENNVNSEDKENNKIFYSENLL